MTQPDLNTKIIPANHKSITDSSFKSKKSHSKTSNKKSQKMPSNSTFEQKNNRSDDKKPTVEQLNLTEGAEVIDPPMDNSSSYIAPQSFAEQEPGFLPVLKNRNFLTLWSGQVFSQLADKVYLVLMIAIISSRFQASDQSISGWVSAIMMAFTIPAVLFGSVAGVFVDRWSKKTVLVSTNILRGILVLSIPVLLWITQDWKAIA